MVKLEVLQVFPENEIKRVFPKNIFLNLIIPLKNHHGQG